MKILHTVEQYEPSVGGMQEVVKQISERLVILGHEVTIATRAHPHRLESTINGVNVIGFDISGNAVSEYKGQDVEKYRRFLVETNFDIVTNFAAQQWATDLALPLLPKIKAKKIFVPTGYSAFYNSDCASYFKQLAFDMKNYDWQVFLSNNYRDINFARENGVENLSVIPNGAAADEFLAPSGSNIRQKLGIPKDHLLILHVGSHTRRKGHPETIELFNEAKIQNATLLLVGNPAENGCWQACTLRGLLASWLPFVRTRLGKNQAVRTFFKGIFRGSAFKSYGNGKRIRVCSLNRQETVAAYKEADLFLFPSEVECSPIVLFECMASKTPFLTSEVGNTAEIIVWSGGGKLLPSLVGLDSSKIKYEESLMVFEILCHNRSLRNELGEAGFEAWKKRFTWEGIALDYQALYLKLLSR